MSLRRLQVRAATASKLERDDKPSLLASFTIERVDETGLERGFFLIAQWRTDNRGYEPVFVWEHQAASEVEGQVLDLVDNMDIDRDGVHEVVTRLAFYENYKYEIYKKDKVTRAWRKVFETRILGCL